MGKIGFINTTKTWGGGEKWHFENALALLQKSYEVQIICYPKSELHSKCIKYKIPYLLFKADKFSFLNPLKISKANSILNDFSTVILNSPLDLKLFASSKSKNTKVIYRRGSAIPIRNTPLNNKLIKNLDLIIANSEATKSTIFNSGISIEENKITVLPNGINILPKQKAKPILETIILGNLGRAVEQKNQLQLIDIAALLRDKGLDYKLIIGGDGTLFSSLKNKVKELELENFVELVGEVKSQESFYKKINIFLLSSKWEGFGYVIAESFNYGKPVIAFDISSNPELIKNNENGFLVKAFDSESFANKIIELSRDKKKIYELGENAYSFIQEHRSFEKSIEKLTELIC
ncbi:glycosyltransferase family 4 protein [Candidatus Kapabacteria bacterium]|nr:glycosyltransferase family 4 protein [Candidatus Kapabacteria bacterium]